MALQVQEIHLKGTPISRGVAFGKPYFFYVSEDSIAEFSINMSEIENEILRYRKAVYRSCEDIKQLQRQLEKERILEGAAILEAHHQMLQDPLLTTNVEKQIRKTKKNVESIVQHIVKECQRKFSEMEDSFFSERFRDIRDITQRILSHLRNYTRVSLANIPPNSIVFARELTATDAAEVNTFSIGAFVIEIGGETSHAAIVAKARGIPYVTSVGFDGLALDQESFVIVDGRTGDIFVNPSSNTTAKYTAIKSLLGSHMLQLDEARELEAETFDGYKVHLSANIEMLNEVDLLHQNGGKGVGLFRSEYVFLSQENFPSEEEQFFIYRQMVEKMVGLPIVIRTFDVGGDKQLPSQIMLQEVNPFLGCRAIRFMLKEREIFKSQLRAILRAAIYGEVSIMFPMVSALSELLEAKEVLSEAQSDLQKSGVPYSKAIRIGCMIEVPSAAIIADLLAKECDFLSIGTNDLVQYSLAVDRSNQTSSGLYTPSHPSVIRLIKLIVTEANHQGIPVTVCGEVAADPRFTPLLLGLGVHELSVASRYLPMVKYAIRNTSIVEANALAEKVLRLTTAADIEELLAHEYRRSVPEDCFYNI
jgi:phosphotransferase system enzyme I (PtsI)